MYRKNKTMIIEVTRDVIKSTSGSREDIKNCVCARAITVATGRPCHVGYYSGAFYDGKRERFDVDSAGQNFVSRYVMFGRFRLFGLLQPIGSFEISWNPEKNWTYNTPIDQIEVKDTNEKAISAPTVVERKRFDEILVSR